jgi:hypothetical protein
MKQTECDLSNLLAGISVNPVSGFYHLFVPVDRAEEAMRLLVMPERP